MAHHTQVPFKTSTGKRVEVDEGIYSVLMQLRRLGVRTQYSCQGGVPKEGQEAYVLADYMSFRKAIKKIKRNVRRGSYSPDSHRVAKLLLFSSNKEFVIVWFEDNFRAEKKASYATKFRRRNYSYEVQLDNKYGMRTTLRWPSKETPAILNMLRETM